MDRTQADSSPSGSVKQTIVESVEAPASQTYLHPISFCFLREERSMSAGLTRKTLTLQSRCP